MQAIISGMHATEPRAFASSRSAERSWKAISPWQWATPCNWKFGLGFARFSFTAVVRNVTATGAGVEFVHMKPRDRELLRRLITQLLK